jgi:hypothetical protein
MLNGVFVQDQLAPFINPETNRTMVPLRLVAEAMDAQVGWVEETRTVTVVANGQLFSLQIDVPLPDGMGEAVIVNGRTFVPIAYVAQMLGASINWDAEHNAVYIQR